MRTFEGFTKGINLGGWLSQCGKNYNDEHYSTFITEKDIDLIASWGLDHVRLPIDYNVIQNEDGSFIEERFHYIDDCIGWCRKHNLSIVLDIHKACGFVFDDESYCSFFSDGRMQDIFVKLWEEMSRRYGNKSYIAFELLNEVTSAEFTESWNRIIARTIPAIRKIAPKTSVIVGGIYNSSITGLNFMEAPYDDNVVFTFHCYSPLIYTHQGAPWIATMPVSFRTEYPQTIGKLATMSTETFGNDYDGDFIGLDPNSMIGEEFFEHLFAPAIAISEKYNVPLYCGEYGVIDRADPVGVASWYRDIHAVLEKHNISRSAWTYKQMDFGIIDEHYKDVYDILKASL